MDFHAETEKRKQKHLLEIYQLSYERFGLSKVIAKETERMEKVDQVILERERAVDECNQAQRDFGTYLAVKEKAMTLKDIEDAVKAGESPPGK